MKIGILTFHCAHNYGAVLQCYALQEYLKGLGHDVEIIDYRPNYLLNPYKIFKVNKTNILAKRLKNVIKAILMLGRRYVRYYKFNRFINQRLNLSYKKNYIPDNYDVYIIGSDQVWNPGITNGFDPIYFADFSFKKGSKIYATYAASMESKKLSNKERLYYVKNLNNFDYVSVRENALANLLQPLTDKTIETVLDPTLIVDKKIWDSIAVKPKINCKYILVYQVLSHEKTFEIAEEKSKELNARIIELTPSVYWGEKSRCKSTISPEEFIGFFKYASFVVTTSFHGTVFSIINNKPFGYLQVGNGTRVKSLLSYLNLENHIINDAKSMNCIDFCINYENINSLLSSIQINSKEYISKILFNK